MWSIKDVVVTNEQTHARIIDMKAVYIQQQGDVEELVMGELPEPEVGEGEALVRIHAAALNHLDLYARAGENGVRVPSFPHVLGEDMAGEVVAVGSEVPGIEVGQRVLVDYVIKCDSCEYCIIGYDELCRRPKNMGVDLWGGYAQYVKAPYQNIHSVPDWMSYEEAASIPLVFHTAWHCLVTRAGLRPGETVLINAAGSGVGTAGIQVARAMNARVLVTAGSDFKIDKSKELGAEAGFNYNVDPAFRSFVRDLTDGDGADVIFDSVGASLWEESYASLRRGGRFVTCGVTSGHQVALHLGQLFTKGLNIMGSGTRSRREFKDFMNLVNVGSLRGVVYRVFPLAEAREAHRLMESRDVFGKIVLRIP